MCTVININIHGSGGTEVTIYELNVKMYLQLVRYFKKKLGKKYVIECI